MIPTTRLPRLFGPPPERRVGPTGRIPFSGPIQIGHTIHDISKTFQHLNNSQHFKNISKFQQFTAVQKHFNHSQHFNIRTIHNIQHRHSGWVGGSMHFNWGGCRGEIELDPDQIQIQFSSNLFPTSTASTLPPTQPPSPSPAPSPHPGARCGHGGQHVRGPRGRGQTIA